MGAFIITYHFLGDLVANHLFDGTIVIGKYYKPSSELFSSDSSERQSTMPTTGGECKEPVTLYIVVYSTCTYTISVHHCILYSMYACKVHMYLMEIFTDLLYG